MFLLIVLARSPRGGAGVWVRGGGEFSNNTYSNFTIAEPTYNIV